MIRIFSPRTFDVTICGGGLAGLCLARQLKLESPELKVLLIDKDKRPLDSGTHKVGESLIEVGAHYLLNTLQLKDYLNRIHKPKCALRFFTRDGSLPLDQRTEFGTLDFPLIPAVQIDRGVFENDLRQMCVDMGVVLAEGVTVKDIELNPSSGDHTVSFSDEEGQLSTVPTRWVVDAMGRRRYLAKKLGLHQDVEHKASACWWRLPGKWELSDAVGQDTQSEGSTWQRREIGRRWYATNHVLGRGYWVWFIPVASHTSVGIVSDETAHPIVERSSPEKATAWLEKHEPHIAKWLEGSEPSDFLALKDFAHSSKQFYSENRWAMVGEAALFADPYYSTGSDLIALQNNVVTRIVKRDQAGELTTQNVEDYNALVAEVFSGIHGLYNKQYSVFGNDYYQNLKVMWDFDFLLGAVGKLGFGPHVLDEVEKLPELTKMLNRWCSLNIRTQKLLRDWCELAPDRTIERPEGQVGPRGLVTPGIPVFQNFNDQLRMRDAATLIRDCEGSLLEYFQGRAIWLFKDAVRDLKTSGKYPEHEKNMDRVLSSQWLNVDALDLDPATWEGAGLFDQTTGPEMDAEQMEYLVPSPPDRDDAIKMTPTPGEAFWSQVEMNPDSVAVVAEGKRVSYGELGKMVASVHEHLQTKHGLSEGAVVAVGRPGLHTLACFLGSLSAGLSFSMAPESSSAASVARSLGAFIVGPEPIEGDLSSRSATYGALIDGQDRPAPLLPEPTVENRVIPGYYRPDEDEDSSVLRPITQYSLTNLCLYQELALRQFLPVHSREAMYPKMRLSTTSRVGQDWILPLLYGGTLILPTSPNDVNKMLSELKDVAGQLGGQPILGGVPSRLLAVARELSSKADISMLAIDKVPTPSETTEICKAVDAMVSGGIVSWGYEHFWNSEMKAKAALKWSA